MPTPAPLVAAVMITGKDPARVPMALAAIEQFKRQTYQNKILIIVNDGEWKVDWEVLTIGRLWNTPGTHDVDQYHGGILMLFADKGQTLGDLRNIGLAEAENQKADFVIQWDDDDYHHPNRIMYQMAGAAAGHCTLLTNQIRYNMLNNTAFNFRWRYKSSPAIPGTILYPIKLYARYPSISKGEDEEFILDHFQGRCVCLDNASKPELYIRMVHGTNTWDTRHIMQEMPGGHEQNNRYYLTTKQATYLCSVLHEVYHINALGASIIEPRP